MTKFNIKEKNVLLSLLPIIERISKNEENIRKIMVELILYNKYPVTEIHYSYFFSMIFNFKLLLTFLNLSKAMSEFSHQVK